MPFSFRRLVPSMFHRRLTLLAGVAAALTIGLALQLTRLTVVEGSQWRDKAEAALVQQRLISTVRGRILDRRMRVLAADKPSYNISVRYPVITGDWAYHRARRQAYRENRHLWSQWHESQRLAATAGLQQRYEAQIQRLWHVISDCGGLDEMELERRKTAIIRRVKQIASDVWLRRLKQRARELDEPVHFSDVTQPIGEQLAAHPIVTNVSHSAMLRIRRLIAASKDDPQLEVFSRVSVEPDKRRQYPLETMTLLMDRQTLPSPLRHEQPLEITVRGVGLHILGRMRDAWKEDVARRPYRAVDDQGQPLIDLGGYLPGDTAGLWGIEASQESYLRGSRGMVINHLDSDHEQRIEPVAGQDVVLTIDIQLQARIQAIMTPPSGDEFVGGSGLGLAQVQPWHAATAPVDPLQPQMGDPLYGAAVVLDVAQGQVLAAVSTPTFSLNQLQENPGSIWNDKITRPYLNRCLGQPYQPGSTVKPLVLAMAVSDGHSDDGAAIDCAGHLDPGAPNRYRCWIYKGYQSTHGPLAGPESIARSCNIFFYTMGRRLGARRLAYWYGLLGLGRPTGCGLLEDAAGDLPDLSQADQPGAVGFSNADAIFMAIGQGPIRWTPLQAASAYAALARGGYAINPTLILVGNQPVDSSGKDLRMNPRGVAMAMQGLDEAVNQRYGTANHIGMLDGELLFNIPGVRIYGKSGTAQGVPQWLDEDGDRRFSSEVDRIVRRGDHAWVVCLAQRPGSPRPDFVIAVVLEYGGSGGAVAGPVANQILHAMRAEGYL